MSTCTNRVALVTGAGGDGIGRSIALTLAREGAAVIVNFHTDAQKADAVVAHIHSRGGQAIAIKADVTNPDDVASLVEAARERFGQVDILVNSAGGGWAIADYADVPLERWKQVLAGEIDPALLLLSQLVPAMRQAKWGRVVNIGMAGASELTSLKGLAPDYCMGKAARAWLTHATARGEHKHGITVNCVCPGHTPAYETFEQAIEHCDRGPAWQARKGVCPQDTAESVAFLCSDAARFVTGTEITFSG